MKLRELLSIVEDSFSEGNISTPYICGGTPRDKVMGKLKEISDLDLTTGDKTISLLASRTSKKLKETFSFQEKLYSDGHISFFFKNMKIDFSSNFVIPNIEKFITNPTPMRKEIFSRDFTCNALLLSTDLKNVTDPTNRGLKDIEAKMIRTCLKPEITLTSFKNRVVRAIYLAAKLDFEIDSSIISFVKSNPSSANLVSKTALKEKISQALQLNKDKTIFYMKEMNILGKNGPSSSP